MALSRTFLEFPLILYFGIGLTISPMKIGELARRACVNIQTIRFYEREGLVRLPLRTVSGYRLYEDRDLDRIRFIRTCQGLGFTLREIRQLIRLHNGQNRPPQAPAMQSAAVEEVLDLAMERLAVINGKIAALQAMRDDLLALVNAVPKAGPAACARPTRKPD